MEAFRCLTADPPWLFSDRLPGRGRGAAKHYSVMPIHEIQRFPLPAMAETSILFLWRVSSQVEEAYSVVRSWGFTPKTELVWLKKTHGGKRHFGMGRYLRAEHETCVIATRGSATKLVKNKGLRTTFEAPVGRHSAKPDAFYELVETLVEGPYAELFARRRRPGWTCFGDELPEESP